MINSIEQEIKEKVNLLHELSDSANAEILSAANMSGGDLFTFLGLLDSAIRSSASTPGTLVSWLVNENEALKAIIDEDCTCTPLDGGLGLIHK